MDELFGVTEIGGKSMDDEEAGSVRAASEKNGTNTEQIEINTTK
jgi:hypothetical protein